jgi:hypothetical protein
LIFGSTNHCHTTILVSNGVIHLVLAASGTATITLTVTNQTNLTRVSIGATQQVLGASGRTKIRTIRIRRADQTTLTTTVDVSGATKLIFDAAGSTIFIIITDQINFATGVDSVGATNIFLAAAFKASIII